MRRYSLLLSITLGLACTCAWGARVKDISRPIDARHNQLTGYGIVVGLNGTGDSRQTTFTVQSLSSMLSHFGVQVSPATVKVKNVAAVLVTVDLPPYLKPGDRVDALVSSLGDASSLQGGLLIQTPLTGADGQVYAVAMGPVATNSFSVSANGSGVAKNHPTVGLVTSGAIIERAVATTLVHNNELCLSLNEPDFNTADRTAKAINYDLGGNVAAVCDASTVAVTVPEEYAGHVPDLIVRLDNLQVMPDCVAKVVVNERTGTVVMGADVTILPSRPRGRPHRGNLHPEPGLPAPAHVGRQDDSRVAVSGECERRPEPAVPPARRDGAGTGALPQRHQGQPSRHHRHPPSRQARAARCKPSWR